ncbi:MAG: aminotransferase IV, partial [Saprospiraceae bacterium]|nr:aminotransferase IV [Saprospiraceae bacterium]
MLQKFDERNRNIQVFIKDKLVPRSQACINVFDSVVQGGDAVWEGLRLYSEGIFLLERHLNRLMESAHALAFQSVPDREIVRDAIFATLKSNGMIEDCHIRLTLT